jgi:CheY-like chemotaxis protein
MPVILIADACKPSLVMSSEVFKDKIAGATILVASSGRQCLEILSASKPDMCVVDFDLPDVDGVTLIHAMRKTYKGPILLTAYPDKIVEEAVKSDLFAFNDAGAWIPKPVKFDALSEKIDQFLLDKHRLGRRFTAQMETMIIGKGAGRGKRAPKVTGRIVNLSLGGACIELDAPLKMKNGEEMLVALSLPGGELALELEAAPEKKAPVPASTAKARSTANAKKEKAVAKPTIPEARIKCTVAWVDKKCTMAGIQFARLTDVQRKGLEELLRSSQNS